MLLASEIWTWDIDNRQTDRQTDKQTTNFNSLGVHALGVGRLIRLSTVVDESLQLVTHRCFTVQRKVDGVRQCSPRFQGHNFMALALATHDSRAFCVSATANFCRRTCQIMQNVLSLYLVAIYVLNKTASLATKTYCKIVIPAMLP